MLVVLLTNQKDYEQKSRIQHRLSVLSLPSPVFCLLTSFFSWTLYVFEQNAQGCAHKMPFFSKFFNTFAHKYLQILIIEKLPTFRMKCARLPYIEGCYLIAPKKPAWGTERMAEVHVTESSICFLTLAHFSSLEILNIKNPTLAHFRHLSSLFTNLPLYICREPSTNPPLFLQNKPNLLNAQINVSAVMTIGCDNTRPSSPPKQTQFKANQTQFQTKLTKRNI